MFFHLKAIFMMAMAMSDIGLFAVDGALTSLTDDAEVIEDEPVTVECKSNGRRKLRWIYVGLGTPMVTLYSGFKLNSSFRAENRYFVIDEVGRCTLKINGTKLEDAGTYICQETGSLATARTQLTVMDAHPICNWSITSKDDTDNQNVNLSCSVKYAGIVQPVMIWSRNSEIIRDVKKIQQQGSNNEVVTSHISVNNLSGPAEIICTIKFYRNNSNSFVYEWRAPRKQSQYGVHSVPVVVFIAILVLTTVAITACTTVLWSTQSLTKRGVCWKMSGTRKIPITQYVIPSEVVSSSSKKAMSTTTASNSVSQTMPLIYHIN